MSTRSFTLLNKKKYIYEIKTFLFKFSYVWIKSVKIDVSYRADIY